MIRQQYRIDRSYNVHAIEADFEVLVNGKETAHEPDAQGFDDNERLKTTLNDLPHEWV
jgi:hypothetical protein